jgi:predicted transcriptional regulator
MEVPFTSRLETKVREVAAEAGRDSAQYVLELVDHYVDHDRWFRQEVRKGLDQLDRGESIPHEEVVGRIERMFRA